MPDATTEFFNDLGSRGHEPMLDGITGKFRFDLLDGKRTERWLVSVSKGDLAVSKRITNADCIIRTKRAFFDRVASGEANAVAGVMRGEVELDGNWTLLVEFQRLFPGPAASLRSAARRRRRPRRRRQ